MSGGFDAAACALPLESTRKLCLFVLRALGGDDGCFSGGLAVLADAAGVSERCLRMCLTDLEKAGCVERDMSGKRLLVRVLPVERWRHPTPAMVAGVGGVIPAMVAGMPPDTPAMVAGMGPNTGNGCRYLSTTPATVAGMPPDSDGGLGGNTQLCVEKATATENYSAEPLGIPRVQQPLARSLTPDSDSMVFGQVVEILGLAGIPFHRCLREVDRKKIVGWCADGLTREVLAAAIEVARSRKGSDPLSVGYLEPIVREGLARRSGAVVVSSLRLGGRYERVERANREAVSAWLAEGASHA